jgi:hypothetical protein
VTSAFVRTDSSSEAVFTTRASAGAIGGPEDTAAAVSALPNEADDAPAALCIDGATVVLGDRPIRATPTSTAPWPLNATTEPAATRTAAAAAPTWTFRMLPLRSSELEIGRHA